MSYILDALKKAEAERERGQVPGLHAASATPKPDEPFEGHRLPSWAWAALGALMTLVAALVWTLVERDPVAAPAAASVIAPATTSAAIPTDTASVQTPVPSQQRAPATTPEPPSPSLEGDATMTVKTVTPSVPTSTAPSATLTRSAKGKEDNKSHPAASHPEKPATNQRIHALNELPDEIRQSLPALSFGGAMYSDQPASRMLLINGQAFHEGDKITRDLTLREIKLRSAVLVFKGYSYAVNY